MAQQVMLTREPNLEVAKRFLAQAEVQFETSGMRMHAALCRSARSGDRESIVGELRIEGVREVERFLTVLAPGAHRCFDENIVERAA